LSLGTAQAAAAPERATALRPRGRRRWIICGLLLAAIVLSYVDRQVLSVLKPYLQHAYGWSEIGYGEVAFWFQAIYGVGYLAFGRVVDRFGERVTFAVAAGLWAVGQAAHVLARSTGAFTLVRIPLALGEAGAFPSALAAISAWFPARERAVAIGLFNAGSNVGAILTPLIVPVLVATLGWRSAFLITGGLTAAWAVLWFVVYRRPRDTAAISAAELAYIEAGAAPPSPAVPWRRILTWRATWAYAAGRFLIDPVWWTFLFWLPDFFTRRFGVDMRGYGPPLVVIYVLADLGSIGGGWLSSGLVQRGFSLNAGRKLAMLLCALATLPVAFAPHASGLWPAVLLIALACAAHQGFSANLYALPADLLPRGAVGSVAGVGGLAGALGGMLMARYAGQVLQSLGSYGPIFGVAAFAYLAALLVVHALTPRYRPIAAE
jgi:ACS family hexuronate transporter-like MFS transporter